MDIKFIISHFIAADIESCVIQNPDHMVVLVTSHINLCVTSTYEVTLRASLAPPPSVRRRTRADVVIGR